MLCGLGCNISVETVNHFQQDMHTGDDLVRSTRPCVDRLHDHIIVGDSIRRGPALLCKEKDIYPDLQLDVFVDLFAAALRHELIAFVKSNKVTVDKIPTLGAVCTVDHHQEQSTVYREKLAECCRTMTPSHLFWYMTFVCYGHPPACQGCQYGQMQTAAKGELFDAQM